MKKILFIIPFAALLAGCEDPDIMYQGQMQPMERVERIIENKLELENPDLDLEVNIMVDYDDGEIKVKKKK